MKYVAPVVVDFGSIADHTFIHTNKTGHRSTRITSYCETDKFGEYSCGSHGGSTS